MTLISVILVFFFIMDPIGNISTFLQVMRNVPPARQKQIILREMCIALGLMLFFFLLGETILSLFQLSETTLRITSGLILFLVGIGILFIGPYSIRQTLQPEDNPILVPLALPLTAGPSLLATIMLYARMETSVSIVPIAIVVAWAFGTAILYYGAELERLVTKNALMAAERLCGMILVMLAIQRFAEGVQLFVNTYHTIH